MSVKPQILAQSAIHSTPAQCGLNHPVHINRSEFGLQAAVFSNYFRYIHDAIDALHVGGVVVNDSPTCRINHMPYGGVKGSGIGREGIHSAMLEMTGEKMVVLNKG